MDQDDRFGLPDRADGDAVEELETTLRAAAADQPVQGNAGNKRAAPSLRCFWASVVPVQLRARLVSFVHALLREAPGAVAVAAAYHGVADDGDLGLAAWARCVLVYSALIIARTSAVRATGVLAGHPLAAAQGLRPVDAVRDILVVLLALAAALVAIYFP